MAEEIAPPGRARITRCGTCEGRGRIAAETSATTAREQAGSSGRHARAAVTSAGIAWPMAHTPAGSPAGSPGARITRAGALSGYRTR